MACLEATASRVVKRQARRPRPLKAPRQAQAPSSTCLANTSRTSPSRARTRRKRCKTLRQIRSCKSPSMSTWHARSDVGVIYNIELFYAGLFRLRNVPQNLLQPVLFVDCPALLFPFTRRVLADVTRDGGYPPLMLDPIDFGRLYSQNRARGQGQASN